MSFLFLENSDGRMVMNILVNTLIGLSWVIGALYGYMAYTVFM